MGESYLLCNRPPEYTTVASIILVLSVTLEHAYISMARLLYDMYLRLNSLIQIGYTFLPCILAGLSNAPQYLTKSSESLEKSCILASDVDSVVLPLDACGGDGALAFATSKRKKVHIQRH